MAQNIEIGKSSIDDIPDNLDEARTMLWLSPDATVQEIMHSLNREVTIARYANGLNALQIDAILTLARRAQNTKLES